VRDHHDGDAVAERALVVLGVVDMRQRIVVRLEIEHRRAAGRVVLRA
jgi:hypothetical protein